MERAERKAKIFPPVHRKKTSKKGRIEQKTAWKYNRQKNKLTCGSDRLTTLEFNIYIEEEKNK